MTNKLKISTLILSMFLFSCDDSEQKKIEKLEGENYKFVRIYHDDISTEFLCEKDTFKELGNKIYECTKNYPMEQGEEATLHYCNNEVINSFCEKIK